MTSIGTGIRGLPMEGPKRTSITLNASGTATLAVVFAEAFTNVPVVLIIPPFGADITKWTAASITAAGFTLTVTTEGTAYQSKACEVGYFAHGLL